jgi:hypothetical protein
MSYYVYKYIKLYMQWDPYPFLFRSPARYDTNIYAYSLIDLLWIPCQTCSFPPPDLMAHSCPYRYIDVDEVEAALENKLAAKDAVLVESPVKDGPLPLVSVEDFVSHSR